jgi:UDP-N-acetyl-D-mannosaminuronic acid dehydrogenase
LGRSYFEGKHSVKDSLSAAIEDRTAHVVVLGLGYVGLPVACLFAEAGFPVVGIRRSQDKVDMVNRGECPIQGQEPGLAELLRRAVGAGRFRATTDYAVCRDARIVLIAVETPVDPATKKPAYRALRGALTDLGHNLSRGTMVIVESTIAPGTMERVVRPILEETSGLRASEDFYLVNCPERVMPGKLLANIRRCHRVVGGMSPEAAELAVRFYRHVVQADLDPADCLTAELVKAMENTYRDVQIAFANEMALLCESMGADVWRVRELVNKSPYRDMHLPGAGVGGHCLPKDPWLLIANAGDGYRPRLVAAARAINDGMPLHVADLVVEALREAGRDIAGARVAVLGYAYLENSDDTRNSPSAVLVKKLRARGAEVVVHDPYVPEYRGDLLERVHGCDAVVVMVRHEEYRALPAEVLDAPVVVDGRNVVSAVAQRKVGREGRAVIRSLGRG